MRLSKRPFLASVDGCNDCDEFAKRPLTRYKIVCNRKSFTASLYLGISPKEYRWLRRWNMPQDFLQLLCYTHAEFQWVDQDMEVTEWMSGKEKVVQAGQDR